MQLFKFEYVGRLYGYRQATRQSLWKKRNLDYGSWKRLIRLLANTEGIPQDLEKNQSAAIDVTISWAGRARIDGKNILGAIEDAIFTRDRRVLRGSYHAIENRKQESVLVVVTIDD